ncbi:ferrous iron transport protein B [Helicobacter sp. MIT 00-7814]|uniref:ferrous iron transport protein B n=1 Tax=unclassified Helicobacter TaxID=2593540 RepID=UPI000E1E99E8|nr:MULTISPECIES: ferrous iron transport protein B [unclassified Helicobacter]RDU51549.1 ferrous iron transport protein B [Helicobacter sp. MIT 00-7814]RDU51635.1 ferrous iron transport protein B [Helicobacter sp. MIT 99-10781]
MQDSHKTITIALVGQPNVGKSSLINAISGANLKVGNFSGVTIEKTQTTLFYKDYKLDFIDLPGLYMLNEYSEEERISSQFLQNSAYDVIVNVVDSTNLARNLCLSLQLKNFDKKMLLALNMSDEAKKEHLEINPKLLMQNLGVPCVSVSAKNNENITALLEQIIALYKARDTGALQNTNASQKLLQNIKTAQNVRWVESKAFDCFSPTTQAHLKEMYEFLCAQDSVILEEILPFNAQDPQKSFQKSVQYQSYLQFLSIALLSKEQSVQTALTNLADSKQSEQARAILAKQDSIITALLKQKNEDSTQELFAQEYIIKAHEIATKCTIKKGVSENLTQRLDKIFLNKYLGIVFFLFFMWGIFEITFVFGEYPKEWIEGGMASVGEVLKEYIPIAWLGSLVSDGILAGVSAVLSFLPHILLLFLGIIFLETTGYMARVAYLLDGFLHKFGLHGKSFIPLVTGFGCSVPAFMATRTLKNKTDKLLTLFIINFMSCSARLPIYTLFVGIFFPANIAGSMLFGIYIFGAIVGLCMAKFLKLSIFRGHDEPFIMEIPKYRLPSLKLITISVYQKAKMYVKKAGGFIMLASMLIWFGTSYPKNSALESEYEQKISALQTLQMRVDSQNLTESHAQDSQTLTQNAESTHETRETNAENAEILALENELQSKLLEQSFLGRIGEFIAPAFAPMEFDWRLCVSLLNGLAAKEVVISSMGVLYALGEGLDEESQSLQEIIAKSVSFPTAVAFILFVMFYNPCLAASVVFAKEAGSWKYLAGLFVFTSIVAYIFSFLGYKIVSAFV